ncbi:hypothetical protein [Mahella australiensis]|uniref:Uncharacterized protein n=1 Tax=Mahella australiensis (strain DSM 15567 / CIP 107919 / 50-1 BON) TaxID=697281 RepID=F4A100_MAHA5|nr:hypothetical protein [Mahella australiensis]AEE98077.1 hypothetical protein Mahau_2957 [Mahella australiensis 50-1 BON]
MKMKLNRKILGIVCIVLSLILIGPQFAFADADTTDGDNEIFYEWVEAYVNFHDSEWDWDTYSDGSHKDILIRNN